MCSEPQLSWPLPSLLPSSWLVPLSEPTHHLLLPLFKSASSFDCDLLEDQDRA